jgi:hypothetical protein
MVFEGIDLAILQGLLGGVLLLFGRRFYFLLLGVAGFALGWTLGSSPLLADLGLALGPGARLAVGLVLGVLVAMLAVFVHNVALVLGGAALGAVAGIMLVDVLALPWEVWTWLLVIASTLVGALLVRGVFAVALVVVSAFLGANLILGVLPLVGSPALLTGLGLWILGILVQSSSRRKGRAPARSARRREVAEGNVTSG